MNFFAYRYPNCVKEKNLIVCMSRAMSIYLLAYVKEHGGGESLDLVLMDSPKIDLRYSSLFQEFGIEIISLDKAQKYPYFKSIIRPYQEFSEQDRIKLL